MDYTRIKKVHVVYMTHFDMGFTDLAEVVLDRYMTEFIPEALELAGELNKDGEKKFIWTIGAFLIDRYLRTASDGGVEKMCEAIKRGDIGWHGLAFTTHTELMDRDLMEFDLSYSDRLDARFGKNTTAAKLTDVPGHTKAMISSLAAHGKKYLHIGVNASSMNPEVPKSFRWQSDGEEIVVQYSPVYGSACYIEGMDEVLEFVFLGDNLGIPSKSQVLEQLDLLKQKYPCADVCASTLDAYAENVWECRANLPVIREEIGDTWIHGVSSDPLKVMGLKKLLELKNKWNQNEVPFRDLPEYPEFMEKLLMVCEHTWALDYKKHIFDFQNWSKEDFRQAREYDLATTELFTGRNASLLNAVEEELGTRDLSGSYTAYEKSYEEQRRYLKDAVHALPETYQEEVRAAFTEIKTHMEPQLQTAEKIAPYERVELGAWKAAFDGTGAMVYLEKDGRKWIDSGRFGRFSYETYTAFDTTAEYYQYNHAFKENMAWSEADFSKPGLETLESLEHRNYPFGVQEIRRQGNVVELELKGNFDAVAQYGCPAKAMIRYTFEEEILCELIWKDKDANKTPEGLWFDFNLDVENPYLWEMGIMGEQISPLHVVRGGNRRQHCVEHMSYSGADGMIEITNADSPLISVGGRRLFGGCLELPDLTKGFSYCLFNNKWGTNFPMWCEDDAYFRYYLKIKNYQ